MHRERGRVGNMRRYAALRLVDFLVRSYKLLTVNSTSMNYQIALIAMFALAFSSTPAAMASTISVTNDNTSTISNSVSISASTGGNESRGGRGARGGDAGSASASGDGSATGGDGGDGGAGGDGGNIQSGDAYAEVIITNEANDTETTIEGCGCDDEDNYDETLDIIWGRDASASESYDREESHEEEEEDASSTSGPSTTSSSSSSSSSDEESESYDAESASSEDYELHYTRTYVGDDDVITVSNTNESSIGNSVGISATTGDNESNGRRGARGGDAGSASASGDTSSASGGDGGAGGAGGDGGGVLSGDSTSIVDILSVSGRTVTRITR
jgi:hypothetical protein